MDNEMRQNPAGGRGWRWLMVPLLLILLLWSVRISLQSDHLLELLRDRAVGMANGQINGSLSVGGLEGDLLSGVTLTDIELRDGQGDLLLSADTLSVRYSALALARRLEIASLRLSGVEIYLEEDVEGWNLQKVMGDGREPVEDSPPPPSFSVGDLQIIGLNARMVTDRLPDGRLALRDLELRSSVSYRGNRWRASLGDLRFHLEEGRIPGGLDIGLSAQLAGEQVTLERLLIGTGRSILSLRADAESEDRFQGQMQLNPLSHLDLVAWAELPVRQPLHGTLNLEGEPGEIRAGVELSADGMDRLAAEALFQTGETPGLRTASLELDRFDGPLFTGLESMPAIGHLRLELEGDLPLADFQNGRMSGTVQVESASLDEWQADLFRSEFAWAGPELELGWRLERESDYLAGVITADEIFSGSPVWNLSVESRNLDLQVLAGDFAPSTDLNLAIEAQGRGLALGEEWIAYQARISGSRVNLQPIDGLELSGRLNATHAEGELRLETGESRLDLQMVMAGWNDEPEYEFEARITRFNLEDLHGVEGFPTDLNATLTGAGSSFDPERIRLGALVEFDSSMVNREEIGTLQAALQLDGPVLTLRNAVLESPIADASFSARQHLGELRDPDNRIDMYLQLKNLQPLAPLFGVGQLAASGSFNGSLGRQESGDLLFAGDLQLNELLYGEELRAMRADGTIRAELLENPVIALNLSVLEPSISGFRIASVDLGSTVAVADSVQSGDLNLEIRLDDRGGLRHEAEFQASPGQFEMNTSHLELASDEHTLALREPFSLTVREGSLTSERFALSAPGGAFLELSIPRLDEERQQIRFASAEVDLGTLQELILGERFAEAVMSGTFDLDRSSQELMADADLLFKRVVWQRGEVDSLGVGLRVSDRRLGLKAGLWHEGERLLTADADIPFEPGDPAEFEEDFFEEPVSGRVEIPESALAFWMALVPGTENLTADGRFAFEATLTGLAGDPAFEGQFGLSDGILSGVPVSLAELRFDYLHENSRIDLEGALHSRGNRVAEVMAELPLRLDLRGPGVDMPEDSDEVVVEVLTDQLDLALLNEFMDRDRIRDIAGRIDGSFRLTGPLSDLESNGGFRLRGGALRVVETNMLVTEIRADLQIRPDRFDLEGLSMRSGPGRLTGSGHVEHSNFRPGELELLLEAVQFRIANTSDLNAIIDLESRLSGTMEEPELGGALRFRSGFVMLQNFGEGAVEDVRLEEEEEPKPFPFFENLAMEMSVSFDRQFFIRNRQYLDMEVELAGLLDLVKARGGELELFGSIEGVRGFARPLGRTFQIEDAVVTFHGPAANPGLQIRTFYTPPRSAEEITIWYIIEGDVESPEFRFESDPYLEFQDIISYTLFGRPFHALDSWQQAFSGTGEGSTADMAMELLLDRFGTLAAQQLGIDVVEIDTNRSASGSSTTIKTGWFLSERTFFAVLNEIGGTSPRTLFMLEYMLRRNLELIVTQGDDSREGVDLRWRYDY